jgi:G3E family GTPase
MTSISAETKTTTGPVDAMEGWDATAIKGGDSRVPATVLTGFLGSGKTTLLNYILTQEHGLKIAVIENEFGEVGVDDALVRKKYDTQEEIFEMNNGCICCTVRGDLIRILGKILKKGKMDAIIIETTGLADPAPVAQTFFMDEKIKSMARIDGILTVVDAKHIIQHLDEEKPEGVENEAVEQVAFADRLLINKCDLVEEDYINVVEARLRAINRDAPFTRCVRSEVPLRKLLGIGAFNLENVIKIDPDFLGEEEDDAHECGEDCDHDHGHGHGSKHPKTASVLNADGSRKMDGKKKVHSHDTSTSSVGIREVGELSMVSAWLVWVAARVPWLVVLVG